MGSGIWHPEPKVAQQIRGFMAEHRERWTDVTSNLGSFELAGDSLKRPPRGFDAEDPLIDDLKRKDFMTTASFTHKQITSAGFLDLFETRCRETLPFLDFLCDALELKC